MTVDAAFVILAFVAVGSGVRVFLTWSMARAAFLLLTSFVAVAGVLLLLGSEFLGAITILMMVGEMVIMAVFMVMLMHDPGGVERMPMGGSPRFAAGAALTVFALLAAPAVLIHWPERTGEIATDVTYQIGLGMMEDKMLVFLAAGVALLATMIAALALALHRGRYDRYGDDLSRRAPQDPIQGGISR